MASPRKRKGIDFPFSISPESFPSRADGKDSFMANIRSLFSIQKGEFPMNPNLGTNIHSFIFEEMTPLKKGLLASEVRKVISDNFSNVRVISVDVSDSNESKVSDLRDNFIRVTINYAIADEVSTLSLDF